MANKDKRRQVSESAKHNLLRLFLYGGIFLIILYFFNIIIDSNKKITYIDQRQLETKTIAKATILEGGQNLLIETKDGRLYLLQNFDKKALEQSGISFKYENAAVDRTIKYGLSAILFVLVMMLAIT